MAIPGFTAEASIGPTKEVYRVNAAFAPGTDLAGGTHPQQWLGEGAGWAGDAAALGLFEDGAALGEFAAEAALGGELGEDIEAIGDLDEDGAAISAGDAPGDLVALGMVEEAGEDGDDLTAALPDL